MFTTIIIILAFAATAIWLGWRAAYSRGYQDGHDSAWRQCGRDHVLPAFNREVER